MINAISVLSLSLMSLASEFHKVLDDYLHSPYNARSIYPLM